MVELRVGDIRREIEGLPDDAPAFVDVAGFDLGISFACGGTPIIDPPGAERREDGTWPTVHGLELWAAPDCTDDEERERLAARVAQALSVDSRFPLDAARALGALRADWPSRVEQARAIAVRLEGELAALREALVAIHAAQMVSSSDPEEPTVICQACRTDYPCETRSFLDVITDPLAADCDEFADAPQPF